MSNQQRHLHLFPLLLLAASNSDSESIENEDDYNIALQRGVIDGGKCFKRIS